MRVTVNGVKLFFDVEGAGLVTDGAEMRQQPTLLLLHGGPGADHSIYKPAFSALADTAQIIYLDHRGNGRSDYDSPENWNLAQWGDDVQAFCQALGIVKPVVLGASFGGMVALSYATRHPDHAAALVLISTEAKGGSHLQRRVELFHQLGGPEVGALATRRLIEKNTDPETLTAWLKLALPHYTQASNNPAVASRWIGNPDVTRWFTRKEGEAHRFDFVPELANITCPTLLLGGELDPMLPIECQEDIAAAMPEHQVNFVRFANAGHGVLADQPEQAMELIRDFVTRNGQ